MKLKEYILKVWENADAGDRYKHTNLFIWLCAQDIIDSDDWVVCKDRAIAHIEDAVLCEYYEEHYSTDEDFRTVNVSRGREQYWSERAWQNHAFFCDWQSEHYSDRDFQQVQVSETGDYVCLEANEDDLYYWDSDNDYHNEPEPEEDEDEEEESRDCGRSGYHSDRSTRKRWSNIGNNSKNADVFGVELEMKANSQSDLEAICARANGCGFLAEYDGSLDEQLGVEIVAPPIPLAKFRKGVWSEFMDGIRRLGTGWDAGTGYGIHISITRSTLSKAQQSKFVRFFADNKAFCEAIAGRKETSYARYQRQSWKVCDLYETEKYLAASIRSENRVEVRIFRSTLKFSSFLKNVQFVAALVEFVRHSSLSRNTAVEFIKFASHKSRRNRFRELLAFLADKNLNGSAPESVS